MTLMRPSRPLHPHEQKILVQGAKLLELEHALAHAILLLEGHNLLKGDDETTKFVRIWKKRLSELPKGV